MNYKSVAIHRYREETPTNLHGSTKTMRVQSKPRQTEQCFSHPSYDFRRLCRPTGTAMLEAWTPKAGRVSDPEWTQATVTYGIFPKHTHTQKKLTLQNRQPHQTVCRESKYPHIKGWNWVQSCEGNKLYCV